MKDKILQEFLNSNIKIKSIGKLEEYIDFCIIKNKGNRKYNSEGYSSSAHHHILPNKLFPQYKDINNLNDWNGSHLLYSDHYMAHFLFTEAVDDYGQLYAFCAMHGRDFGKKKIFKEDLIRDDIFQLKMEERGKKYTEWAHKEIIVNGIITTNIQESNKKTLHTKKFGKVKRTKTEQDAKMVETRNKKILMEDGSSSSIEKESRKKQVETKEKKSRRFDLYHKEMGFIKGYIMRKDILKISQALLRTTKDKYLGKQENSKYNLIKNGNKLLIGLYIKEIK